MERRAAVMAVDGGAVWMQITLDTNLACVPQVDTMHAGMSLRVFLNDRNFTDTLFTIFDL